ncbi:MAG: hypothetical protein L0220_22990 [Acidobacteria bacterium]|nr:hypothetical protein [Acidobacteriota bacterium]
MKTRILTTIIAILIIGVIQYVVGLTGNGGVILVCGALMGLLPFGLWKLRGSQDDSLVDLFLPLCAAVFGIACGGLLSREMQSTSTEVSWVIEFWAVLLGLVCGGTLIAWRVRKRADRCQICRTLLTRRTLRGRSHHVCPRCAFAVCTGCWNADSYRCLACERSRTPLLSMEEEDWWVDRLGERQSVGRCIRCRHSTEERDLRKCGNCPRAMCIDCWDMENGRCIGCDWVIPGLPESLALCHER